MSVHWGDVPTWLSAVGTLGAFWYGYRLLRREADRDEQQRTDRRRDQASRVTIWREDGVNEQSVTVDLATGLTGLAALPQLCVDNASDRPVFDVIVAYVDGARAPDEPDAWLGTEALDVIAPGERKRLTIPQRHLDQYGDGVRGIVMFTDSDDRSWRRDPRGELHDVQRDGVILPRPWWRRGR